MRRRQLLWVLGPPHFKAQSVSPISDFPSQIREGFIVDEDEDEEERAARRREKRKRRRLEREEEEAALDDEDLDLIGEANPGFEPRQTSQVRKCPSVVLTAY